MLNRRGGGGGIVTPSSFSDAGSSVGNISDGGGGTPTASPGGGGGEGILAFEASASVNNDLKREIKKEVDDINASVAKTTKEIESESKTRHELRKGQSHAEKENASYRFESKQTSESLKVAGQVLRGLKSTFYTDIAPKSSNNNVVVVSDDDDNNSNNINVSSSSPSSDVKSIYSVTKTMEAQKEMTNKLDADISIEVEKLLAAKKKKKEIESESTTNLADDYQRRLLAKQEENRSSRKVLDHELARERALIINKEKLEQQTVDLDQQIATLTKTLEAKKRNEGLKETEKNDLIAAASNNKSRQEKVLMDMESKLTSLQLQEKRTVDSIKEADDLISQEREKSKDAVEKERAARNKLFSEKGTVVAELTSAKAEYDRQSGFLLEQESLETTIARTKDDNDKMEATYLPIRDELTDYTNEVKESEALVKSIDEHITEAEDSLKKSDTTTELVQKTEEELAGITRARDEKRTKLDGISTTRDEYKTSALLYRELCDGADDQRQDIRDHEDLYKERSEYATLSDWDRKLYILRTGDQTLKETAKQEKDHQIDL